MLRFEGQIHYIESHAGAGKYLTKDMGSPIVAIDTIVNHGFIYRQENRNKRVTCIFFENKTKNYNELKKEISKLESLPPILNILIEKEDYELFLESLEKGNVRINAPLLVIDPYNYDISHKLLLHFFQNKKAEILITFMVRNIALATTHDKIEITTKLNRLFGSDSWKRCLEEPNWDTRCKCLLDSYIDSFGECYFSIISMLQKNGKPKYYLIHLTKSSRGREVFKEAMWATFPNGIMVARESEDPHQTSFLKGEPSYRKLAKLLLNEFRGRSVDYDSYYQWLLKSDFLEKHFNKVCKTLEKKSVISCSSGRFIAKQHPVISFSRDIPNVRQLFD